MEQNTLLFKWTIFSMHGKSWYHKLCNPIFYMRAIMHIGYNGSTWLYNFIKRHYFWRKLHHHHSKYVRSCPECQQVALKELHSVDLHLPIPPFPTSFICMDILGQCHEKENGNQCTLTVICTLTMSSWSPSNEKLQKRSSRSIWKMCTLYSG